MEMTLGSFQMQKQNLVTLECHYFSYPEKCNIGKMGQYEYKRNFEGRNLKMDKNVDYILRLDGKSCHLCHRKSLPQKFQTKRIFVFTHMSDNLAFLYTYEIQGYCIAQKSIFQKSDNNHLHVLTIFNANKTHQIGPSFSKRTFQDFL